MAFDQETLAKVRKRRQATPAKGTPTSGNEKPAARTTTKKPPKQTTAPVDPAQAALDTETAAAIRTKFGPSERAIAGEQGVSAAQQGNITDWFKSYQDDVEKARVRTADFNAGVQKAQADHAIQAQSVDTAAAATPEATQAAAARRSTSDSFGSQLAAQASAQNAYQADQGRIGSGEAVDQHLKESARSRSLAQELKDLIGQKGDFEIGYRADAKAAAHKTALEDAAFDLDTAKAQSDADLKKAAQDSLDADRTADNKSAASKETTRKMEADRKFQLDKDKVGAAAAKDNYQREHGLGPYRPGGSKDGQSNADKRAETGRVDKVRDKSQAALNRLDKASGAWHALDGKSVTTGRVQTEGPDKGDPVVNDKGLPDSTPMTKQQKKDELVKQGYSPNEIHLMLTKVWGKQEVAMAHQLGIRVPRSKLPPKTSTDRPNNASDGSGGTRPT